MSKKHMHVSMGLATYKQKILCQSDNIIITNISFLAICSRKWQLHKCKGNHGYVGSADEFSNCHD